MALQFSWQTGCTTTSCWQTGVSTRCVIELANSIAKERDTLKRITLSALLLLGLCVVGSPMAVAQGTSSQSSATASAAVAIPHQQLALLRREIRSSKKELIAANLTLRASEETMVWKVFEE